MLYADDGTPLPRKRRRRAALYPNPGEEVGAGEDAGSGEDGVRSEREEDGDGGLEGDGEKRSKRECPVPKPGGIVGEILGFRASKDEKGGKPP